MRQRKKTISEEDTEIFEEVIKQIVNAAVEKDAVFEIEGTPKLTVRLKTGEYRKKAMVHSTQFALESGYISAKGTPIFVLDPLETLDFQSLEVSVKEADEAFPLMGVELGKLLEMEVESFPELVGRLTNIQQKNRVSESFEDEERVKENPIWGRF